MGKFADFFREQSITLDGQKKAKMLALDQKFVALESKLDTLEAENLKLRAEVNPLKAEIQGYKNRLQEKPAPAHGDLDPDTERLLIAIVESDGRMPRHATGKALGMTIAKTDFCFDVLMERDYIQETSVDTSAGAYLYGACPKGRKYLADKGKLK